MRVEFINKIGKVEVDPINVRGRHFKWLENIRNGKDEINYYSFKDLPNESSKYLTKYILDLNDGKNLTKGTKKGGRSVNHMFGCKTRVTKILKLLHSRTNRKLFEFTQDDVISLFNDIREGRILTNKGNRFKSVGSYARLFIAFWHWLIRIKKKEEIEVDNIIEDLDTKDYHKPEWFYLTIKDVEKMADFATNIYYKTLVYFLFDSGVRAPKELMNIRAKDITPVKNSELVYLQVRDDTSKTFGRKIKLMISSDHIKKHIEQNKLKPDDFLFTKSYTHTTRTVSRMAYKALGIGTAHKQKQCYKVLIRNGVTMYDFRHSSVCHYLPIYKSENQIKYRYGWRKAEMIHYYSEFLGMKDTISEDDMLLDTTKTELEQKWQKEHQKVQILEEQLISQKEEMDKRLKDFETMVLQKFSDSYNKENKKQVTHL
jgi:hypothetical protein